jgi:hypothetical protein
MCADHDTRCDEGYASGGEILPGERPVARQPAGVTADPGRSSNCPAPFRSITNATATSGSRSTWQKRSAWVCGPDDVATSD